MATPPGLRDLMPGIATILASQWTITNPTTSLATVRIMGRNDADIGTVGWLPPQNGQPFAVISVEAINDNVIEPNRVWAKGRVAIFVGIDHADTPSVNENYNDIALAWIEAARQVVANNRRVGTFGTSLFPTSGDTRWEMLSGAVAHHHVLLGTPWYGVQIITALALDIAVTYQF